MERPAWALSSPLLQEYYDTEWGVPVRDARGVYERITLEGFQSGLSWATILRKRPAFRAAFAGFDPEAVAAFDEADVARLMADAGIVRNRAKITAAISNARALLAMHDDGLRLTEHIAAYAPEPRERPPLTFADVPSQTSGTVALSKDLQKRGFRFVGPTTLYALMQAVGLVDDHIQSCWLAPRA